MNYTMMGSNLLKRNILKNICCYIHNDNNYSKLLIPLKDKKILKIQGKDSQEFLQGLVTNDMRHFEDGAKSMFTMFLNNKGRLLYDAIIYKWGIDEEKYLIECDKIVFSPLLKHLKTYKLKRDVQFEDMNTILRVWALISIYNDILPEAITDINSPVNVFKDPRITQLGCRILTAPEVPASHLIKVLSVNKEVRLGADDIYKYLRYKLGVGEGAVDMPPGQCLPLEMNCDYLHGVSFHKGCYIGQELTARIYHTGVIRKRLMPIKFSQVIEDYIENDTVIKNEEGKSNLGKLKGYIHDHGLGLIRIKEALDSKILKIGDHTAETLKPTWWPLEASKDKSLGETTKS